MTELRANNRLRVLFKLMLDVGNYLNSSSSPPQPAAGFRLTSLSKFAKIRSTTCDLSLLEWIVSQVQDFPYPARNLSFTPVYKLIFQIRLLKIK